MIGKMLGALVGGKVAQHVRGIEGPTGAALGVLAPAILRRMSWPTMLALGVGGYLARSILVREVRDEGPVSASQRTQKSTGGQA